MKHPWQVWSLFGLCLAMVLPGMVWLTYRAIQLDRAEALAQQHADLEETIGSALWQMDTELTRLLAVEIARPASFYRSLPAAADTGKAATQLATARPVPPSPYVHLHFELRPDGTWSSPQCSQSQSDDIARKDDAPQQSVRGSQDRLDDLAQSVGYDDLIGRLPRQNLEADWLAQNVPSRNTGLLALQNKVFQNTFDLPEFRQQLDVGQLEATEGDPDGPLQQQAVTGANPYLQARNQRIQQRRSNELQNRDEALQAAAQQAFVDNYLNTAQIGPPASEVLGVSQPLWVGQRLLLARRVETGGETVIQGCWLDWPKIKAALLERIEPILPGADLEPVLDPRQVRFSRVLATLPVQLIAPDAVPSLHSWSSMEGGESASLEGYRGTLPFFSQPLRVSLWVAWGFFALATLALAVLLRGVVTLSERRAAFVSAVTHELRTPLTTFRMYAEMLAEGMVVDEGQRNVYLQTLKAEADRLTHLVENVLQYARLERNSQSKRRETIRLNDLLERIEPRLRERAEQAEMTIVIEADAAQRQIQIATDPAAIEQILFNLVDNACKYARASDDRRIHCRVEADTRAVRIEVRDHGPGISRADTRRLFQPFSKSAQAAANSAPGVGLGLALSRRLASQLDGRLTVSRGNEPGASFTLRLPRSA
ncbi:MAG: HAMP domain-containing histidine kinase [Pirellulaceae bacterium]|nr:HAMP domain-containing histidine kinase [Pirellulaceae bacterium]